MVQGVGDSAMQKPETSAHDGIARSRKPAVMLFGEAIDVTSESVHEQRLRKLGQHRFAADAS